PVLETGRPDDKNSAPVIESSPAEISKDHDQHITSARQRIDLPISGMTCAACAHHIEQKLSSTPGVLQAGVNFATGRATVYYDWSAPAGQSCPRCWLRRSRRGRPDRQDERSRSSRSPRHSGAWRSRAWRLRTRRARTRSGIRSRSPGAKAQVHSRRDHVASRRSNQHVSRPNRCTGFSWSELAATVFDYSRSPVLRCAILQASVGGAEAWLR